MASAVALTSNTLVRICVLLVLKVVAVCVPAENEAPSTDLLSDAAANESSCHSNTRADTFSDLIEVVKGVSVVFVHLGALVPGRLSPAHAFT